MSVVGGAVGELSLEIVVLVVGGLVRELVANARVGVVRALDLRVVVPGGGGRVGLR